MVRTSIQTRRLLVYLALFGIASLACEITIGSKQATPVTQVVSPTARALHATFLGQDGGNYAGQSCKTGTTSDNVHIHLEGLRTNSQPSAYTLQEQMGTGVWATPCNPVSNWLLYASSSRSGEADLYFKPYRDAPEKTEYVITIQYNDGKMETVSTIGSQVKLLETSPIPEVTPPADSIPQATFLGQDGGSYAGKGCATGDAPDNIHIRLKGLKTDVQVISFQVADSTGLWAFPCDPVSNWLIRVISESPGQADLYFKPYRAAPDGTIYTVTIQYSDGTIQSGPVVGRLVQP
jgi:hypothetical protein